jgi:hypothetical protein
LGKQVVNRDGVWNVSYSHALFPLGEGSFYDWSKDGRRIAVAAPDRLRVYYAPGHVPQKVLPSLPPGTRFHNFETHTYALISEKLDWQGAKRRCEHFGGHLLTLDSDKEWEFISKAIIKDGVYCWVGASDQLHEGDWRWVDEKRVPRDKYWNKGEPNGGRVENYCMIFGVGLNDGGPSYPHFFICEWDEEIPIPPSDI